MTQRLSNFVRFVAVAACALHSVAFALDIGPVNCGSRTLASTFICTVTMSEADILVPGSMTRWAVRCTQDVELPVARSRDAICRSQTPPDCALSGARAEIPVPAPWMIDTELTRALTKEEFIELFGFPPTDRHILIVANVPVLFFCYYRHI